MDSKKPHRNLKAWQKTMDLVIDIYRVTGKFPPAELYGLTSQLRRAAVSGPSNIAEGAVGRSKQQFSNFLSNAIGSLNEVETQLELALRLDYVTRADYDRLCRALDECLALTYGLRKAVSKQEQVRVSSKVVEVSRRAVSRKQQETPSVLTANRSQLTAYRRVE